MNKKKTFGSLVPGECIWTYDPNPDHTEDPFQELRIENIRREEGWVVMFLSGQLDRYSKLPYLKFREREGHLSKKTSQLCRIFVNLSDLKVYLREEKESLLANYYERLFFVEDLPEDVIISRSEWEDSLDQLSTEILNIENRFDKYEEYVCRFTNR